MKQLLVFVVCFMLLLYVAFELGRNYEWNNLKEKYHVGVLFSTELVPMPDYYRRITGNDSIQLVLGGRGRYNNNKKDFDVTWDSLYANFCHPNEWEQESIKNHLGQNKE